MGVVRGGSRAAAVPVVKPETVNAFVQACDPATPPVPSAPGSICEADGWCWDSPLPMSRPVGAITRSASGVVVASKGGLVRLEGNDWKPLESPLDEPHAVWSSGGNDLFAANHEKAAKFDGTTWQTWDMPYSVTDLRGSSPTNVWAILAGEETLAAGGTG